MRGAAAGFCSSGRNRDEQGLRRSFSTKSKSAKNQSPTKSKPIKIKVQQNQNPLKIKVH